MASKTYCQYWSCSMPWVVCLPTANTGHIVRKRWHAKPTTPVVRKHTISSVPNLLSVLVMQYKLETCASKGHGDVFAIIHFLYIPTRFVALHSKIPPCCVLSDGVSQSATVSICPLCCGLVTIRSKSAHLLWLPRDQ